MSSLLDRVVPVKIRSEKRVLLLKGVPAKIRSEKRVLLLKGVPKKTSIVVKKRGSKDSK